MLFFSPEMHSFHVIMVCILYYNICSSSVVFTGVYTAIIGINTLSYTQIA